MSKTFWVTLRKIPMGNHLEAWDWLKDHKAVFGFSVSGMQMNPSSASILDHVSYSFNSETDAMLFKLTFAEYL